MRDPNQTRVRRRPGGDAEGPQDLESRSQERQTRRARATALQLSGSRRAPGSSENRHGKQAQGRTHLKRTSIKDKPSCSHACLHRLTRGVDMDARCPNFRLHGSKVSGQSRLSATGETTTSYRYWQRRGLRPVELPQGS